MIDETIKVGTQKSGQLYLGVWVGAKKIPENS